MKNKKAFGAGQKDGNLLLELHAWLESLVMAILFIILLFVFVGRAVGVEGSSMNPTLENHDLLLMSNVFYTPGQGDVIIFENKGFEDGPLVKRIIAVGGQTVDIDPENGWVVVNGEIQAESYIAEETHLLSDVSFPVTVPGGCVFVMGDNRNASTDSRSSQVGMVDTRSILGKVYAVIAPPQHMKLVK